LSQSKQISRNLKLKRSQWSQSKLISRNLMQSVYEKNKCKKEKKKQHPRKMNLKLSQSEQISNLNSRLKSLLRPVLHQWKKRNHWLLNGQKRVSR
jgi:hypothetical protein